MASSPSLVLHTFPWSPTAGALAGPGRGLRERCMLLNWQTWTWEESVEVIGAV